MLYTISHIVRDEHVNTTSLYYFIVITTTTITNITGDYPENSEL